MSETPTGSGPSEFGPGAAVDAASAPPPPPAWTPQPPQLPPPDARQQWPYAAAPAYYPPANVSRSKGFPTWGWVLIGLGIFVFVAGPIVALGLFASQFGDPGGLGGVSVSDPTPYYDTNVINSAITPKGVSVSWDVTNSGDRAGLWSCTVVVADQDGNGLARSLRVASKPLLVNQRSRQQTFVPMSTDLLDQVDISNTDVSCDEPW